MNTEFQKIIDFRRSNRSFDPNVPVPEEVIRVSLERAILSPNSSNMQLWEFYWLESKAAIDQMIPLCLDQQAAATAKQMVVFVTRKDKWRMRANWNLDRIKETVELILRVYSSEHKKPNTNRIYFDKEWIFLLRAIRTFWKVY